MNFFSSKIKEETKEIRYNPPMDMLRRYQGRGEYLEAVRLMNEINQNAYLLMRLCPPMLGESEESSVQRERFQNIVSNSYALMREVKKKGD